MSCAPGAGCCQSCSGLGSFGAPRQLSGTEVDMLLSRNPSISARVLEWNALLSVLDWSQVQEAGGLFSWTVNIPGAIPPEGIRFEDSVFGTVIVFPDASGTLHFVIGSNSSAGVSVGPSGLPALPNFAALTTLGILAFGYLIFREVRRV